MVQTAKDNIVNYAGSLISPNADGDAVTFGIGGDGRLPYHYESRGSLTDNFIDHGNRYSLYGGATYTNALQFFSPEICFANSEYASLLGDNSDSTYLQVVSEVKSRYFAGSAVHILFEGYEQYADNDTTGQQCKITTTGSGDQMFIRNSGSANSGLLIYDSSLDLVRGVTQQDGWYVQSVLMNYITAGAGVDLDTAGWNGQQYSFWGINYNGLSDWGKRPYNLYQSFDSAYSSDFTQDTELRISNIDVITAQDVMNLTQSGNYYEDAYSAYSSNVKQIEGYQYHLMSWPGIFAFEHFPTSGGQTPRIQATTNNAPVAGQAGRCAVLIMDKNGRS